MEYLHSSDKMPTDISYNFSAKFNFKNNATPERMLSDFTYYNQFATLWLYFSKKNYYFQVKLNQKIQSKCKIPKD
jgi:hypothetical protein